MKNTSEFRYDISFLRVFSVLAVVLYHFKIPFLQGGFVGVDVFFVISGFLMTKIILTGFQKRNFNYGQFCVRRAQRIIPALLSMILIFGIVLWALLPVQIYNYLKVAASSSLFLSNIQYYFTQGYFSTDAQTNFLLHTWSLSVEWQFYLIYPLILGLLKNYYIRRSKFFLVGYLGFLFLSFASMIYANNGDASLSFYMFFSRAWEMMMGGLAFLIPLNFKCLKTKISLVGLALFGLVACVVLLDEKEVVWPSYITLIPVLLSALILAVNVNVQLFKTKTIQILGDTSYSFYLWHWPIYVLGLYFDWTSNYKTNLLLITLAFVIAYGSYYFIEKQRQYRVKSVLWGNIVLCLFFSVMYWSKPTFIFKTQKEATLAETEAFYNDSPTMVEQYHYGSYHLSDEQEFKDYSLGHLKPSSTKPNVLLIGDSHAGVLAHSLKKELNGVHLLQATADAAFPVPRTDSPFQESVKLFNYLFDSYLPRNYKKIDAVIISANYAAHADELKSYVGFLIQEFDKYHIPYVFVGQTPSYAYGFPTAYYLKNKYHIVSEANRRKARFNQAINSQLKENLGHYYVDLLTQPVTTVNNRGQAFVYDHGHLSLFGAEQYSLLIVKQLHKLVKPTSKES